VVLGILTLGTLLFGVAFLLHVEWRRHRGRLERIPIRINVNGTRGKSSVTRLVTAILREAGIATVGKTTGTAPQLILPDGHEVPVRRNGLPTIRELIWALKRASKWGAEAVVFECMAVDPELQWTVEHRIIQPTITVITNGRPDHTEAQGSTVDEVVRSFPSPYADVVVTADEQVAEIFEKQTNGTATVHLVAKRDANPHLLQSMPYLEHRENLAIALKVADVLGVAPSVARRGMRRTVPDAGAAVVTEFHHDGAKPWKLVNLFAANDPESTLRALKRVNGRAGADLPIALLACRADRQARSAQFIPELAAQQHRFTELVIWGQKTRAVTRLAREHRIERLVDLGETPPEELTNVLVGRMNGHRTVVGMGNILGPAQGWLDYLGAAAG
jgi:gamma-polyglutamate synthase